jgi:hypothetical protein
VEKRGKNTLLFSKCTHKMIPVILVAAAAAKLNMKQPQTQLATPPFNFQIQNFTGGLFQDFNGTE